MLGALLNHLQRAAALDDTEPELTGLWLRRLASDMHPLFDQVRFACLQAVKAVARLRDHPIADIRRPESRPKSNS